jgi:aspartyl-tRNA(Asn)/glutamyl-tRNA(Gln) amidotransferase subunit A
MKKLKFILFHQHKIKKVKIMNKEDISVEITETIIERIEKINPIVNAYCTTTFDIARDMAKKADDAVKKGEKLGILHGIPTSIKDLMETKGVRTTYGSMVYENFIPEEDAISVKRLMDAGIVFLGKTNTPEKGHKEMTDNLIFGVTKNPWNLERTCGGSSGGAGAAVGAGISPLALGSDGGGSIRVPSCFCGIYGIKPNFGRIPRNITNLAFSDLSHHGPMVRYVKDAALMLDAMAGPHYIDKYSYLQKDGSFLDALKERPKKIRIGYSLNLGFLKKINKDVEKAVLESVHKFEQFDWSVEEVKINLKKAAKALGLILMPAMVHDYKPFLNEWRDKLSPTLVFMLDMSAKATLSDLMNGTSMRLELEKTIYQYFQNYDILISPTATVIAPKLDEVFQADPLPIPFNLSWNPAASIPCGWSSEGVPIGMQIVGRKLDEKTVFQVSKAFEDIAPWQDKRPTYN